MNNLILRSDVIVNHFTKSRSFSSKVRNGARDIGNAHSDTSFTFTYLSPKNSNNSTLIYQYNLYMVVCLIDTSSLSHSSFFKDLKEPFCHFTSP